MTEEAVKKQIEQDTKQIMHLTSHNILYPKMPITSLLERIKECTEYLEEVADADQTNIKGKWMQLHLYDDEPIYAKFKCYSKEYPGYALFYGIIDYSNTEEKVYTPIPLERCLPVTNKVGSQLEFANGLNATKNSLAEMGVIPDGEW